RNFSLFFQKVTAGRSPAQLHVYSLSRQSNKSQGFFKKWNSGNFFVFLRKVTHISTFPRPPKRPTAQICIFYGSEPPQTHIFA
ncbi:hypothetical protein NE619_15940, partial [Anaerovorax odorimutans]